MFEDLADFDDVSDMIVIPPKKGIKNHALDSLSMIVLDDETGQSSTKKEVKFDKAFLDNKNLVKFIEKCFALENSEGMMRIINRTLLGLYKNTCPEYKTSHRFQNILDNAFLKLKLDPKHKFSHIKGLCDALKLHRIKKRARLYTLATNLNQDKDNTTTEKRPEGEIPTKKSKEDVINLDSEHENVIEIQDEDDIICVDNNSKSKKTNKTESSTNESIDVDESDSLEEDIMTIKEESTTTELLVPVNKSSRDIETRIKEIEITISNYKAKIVKLEEQEVCDDSHYSPYIQSEKLKLKIVDLYKELCSLTGDEPIKRREVRLQVSKDHAPAPVEKLEQFLNDNIGPNGEPPFPDFHDVMTCVAEANATECLGWNAVKVMSEANALFIQCGRALQKRRQQREWRDLLSRVKTEGIQDPAEDDPKLLARLEENRRIASKKGRDLMDRFVNIDCDVPSLNLHVDINDSHDLIENDCSDDENDNESNDQEKEQESSSDKDDDVQIIDEVQIKTEKDIKTEKEDSPVNTKFSNCENKNVPDVEVKIEPIDLSVFMKDDDVTSVIFDIEDPFLVIDISSDSEDDSPDNDDKL